MAGKKKKPLQAAESVDLEQEILNEIDVLRQSLPEDPDIQIEYVNSLSTVVFR